MKESLLEELIRIPANAVSATVRVIVMQVIDEERAQAMLASDPDDEVFHEFWLANVHFLCEFEQFEMKALFKVRN